MAAHYLAHDLSIAGMLYTHVTWSFQNVKAHDPRELGLGDFLIPIHRQHCSLERIAVSDVLTITD